MPDPTPSGPRPLSRRRFLGGLAGAGVALAAPVVISGGRPARASVVADGSVGPSDWSSPDTWGGSVPGAGEVVRIDKPVRLDVDAAVSGLVIEPTGSLTFAADRDVTLASHGNVEVYGTLAMRPAAPTHQHRLVFPSVDETAFVGGGMDVVATDVGLWVKDCGRLLLEGAARTGWVRAATGLRAGASQLRLRAVPSGWRAGDELVITPTGSPRDDRHYDRFDEVRIVRIAGDVITLDRPLRFAHPAVRVGYGAVLTAEVLNLTRNVRVEGTPGGRMHTWVHTHGDPSVVRYAAFRHFGPRQPDGAYSTPVLGRYGLHWHMAGDGTRGTVVEGVVARDSGSHAFVAHQSHGIRHTACISYNTTESAFWWDRPADTRSDAPPSDDILYDSCVAARVKAEPDFRGYGMSGFALGDGERNVARNCVATGVLGRRTSSGFQWPEGAPGVWHFTDCVAHNNREHGIRVWQNTPRDHLVQRFIAYHNGGYGVSHGAYRNGYHYVRSILYGNLAGGVEVHASSWDPRTLVFANLLIDGAGLSAYGIQTVRHQAEPLAPTRIHRCHIRGYTRAGIAVTGEGPAGVETQQDRLDVSACTFSGNELWISEVVPRDSLVRYQPVLGPARALRHPRAGRGRLRPAWNAKVSPTSPFSRPTRPRAFYLAVAARSSL